MSVYVTEYGGFHSGRPFSDFVFEEPPIQTTVFSSAATSTGVLAAGTEFVSMVSMGVNAWVLFSFSSTSTTVATATNALPLVANVPVSRNVRPGSRYTVISS